MSMRPRIYSRFVETQLILTDELAIDRTLLANERTLLAYLRAGMALIIAGARWPISHRDGFSSGLSLSARCHLRDIG